MPPGGLETAVRRTSVYTAFVFLAVFSLHASAEQHEVLCRICPDPYQPVSRNNLPVPNENMKYTWVETDTGFKLVPNPGWKGRSQPSDEPSTDEPERDRVCWPGEQTGDCVLTAGADRSDSIYHRSGDEVFRRQVLDRIGGVLSQADDVGTAGHSVTVAIELGRDGSYPGYILVHDGVAEGRYAIDYADLVPMTLFVDSGGTSLYTLWNRKKLPRNFQRDAGFAKHEGGGHVAIEFQGTRYADALHFADTCQGCVAFSDDRLVSRVNAALGVGESSGAGDAATSASYINADIGIDFGVHIRGNDIDMDGNVVRFYWSKSDATSRDVVVTAARPLVSADALTDQITRNIAELDEDQEIRALSRGVDLRERMRHEDSEESRQRMTDTFFLFETLALLRSAKKAAPEEWSIFTHALASDVLVRAERGPWERYTQSYCRVYEYSRVCQDVVPAIALLAQASFRNDVERVRQLVSAGVDVNGLHRQFPALVTAILRGHGAVARVLLDAGADVNLGSQTGLDAKMRTKVDAALTPLSVAAMTGQTDVVELLVRSGANLDAMVPGGTALMLASSKGRTEIARFLIEAGADVDARFEVGNAVGYAVEGGHVEIVRLLVRAGGYKKSTLIGQAILARARIKGYDEIVELLNAAD